MLPFVLRVIVVRNLFMVNDFLPLLTIWKSDGQVTSGVSCSSGKRLEVCIILAMKTCFDVISGATEKGVPW